jgi:CDP-diacylglycerol--serine O-phosphatidyltransferase
MIGFYDYTVILTYLGFASGIFGILMAFNGHPLLAILALMFSGLCDMFDGKVARTKKKRTKEEKSFGIQLDSLSDLVCFGVLPSVIGFKLGINKSYMIPLIVFYPLAGLIRLAYFNMLETLRDGDGPVKEYVGLPITTAALIFPFIYIFRKLLGKYFVLLYGVCLFVVGLLFISKIKIKKPQNKQMILMILVGVLEILLILTVKRFL